MEMPMTGLPKPGMERREGVYVEYEGKTESGPVGMTGRSGLGPLAGQDYEIVEYEIVEEGPERTVSISTWREQAIQEPDSDDAMSVYYVTADDCIHPDATEIDVATEFLPPPRREENVASGSGSNNSGDKSKGSGKSRSSRRRENQPREKYSGVANTSPLNPGMKTYQVTPNSAPRTSIPRGSGTLIQPLEDSADIPPFHATNLKSGSTISSIDLTPATPTLEHVLVSCEPSLVHISPVLRRVGIMRAEHLRAVGKLSEDTRNKEVKEEVLKLGVTVMEWAILLDKLQDL
ncbi:hypothetical protein C8F04DRAFT_64337 [Mycena alexandri]|uniref:Uncharacterized protein n=1 Tax=Mycena alexandri TaxID=1745969 RepID=A0AAD6SJJ9_9AGAR|nr:hypothetical protein C8F04DRAFT_64337 [Mycena alexandri]